MTIFKMGVCMKKMLGLLVALSVMGINTVCFAGTEDKNVEHLGKLIEKEAAKKESTQLKKVAKGISLYYQISLNQKKVDAFSANASQDWQGLTHKAGKDNTSAIRDWVDSFKKDFAKSFGEEKNAGIIKFENDFFDIGSNELLDKKGLADELVTMARLTKNVTETAITFAFINLVYGDKFPDKNMLAAAYEKLKDAKSIVLQCINDFFTPEEQTKINSVKEGFLGTTSLSSFSPAKAGIAVAGIAALAGSAYAFKKYQGWKRIKYRLMGYMVSKEIAAAEAQALIAARTRSDEKTYAAAYEHMKSVYGAKNADLIEAYSKNPQMVWPTK